MCIACLEYSKDKLTDKEFRSALRETTENDRRHFEEVERIFREAGNDPDKLKEKIRKLTAAR